MIKPILDYIVNIQTEYKDHINVNKTKIYVDRRFTKRENAVMKHKIKETPLFCKHPALKKDTEIIIDPVVMGRFLDYHGFETENQNKINEEKDYLLNLQAIYFYKDDKGVWTSPRDYVLATTIKKSKIDEKIGSLFIPQSIKDEIETNKILVLSNSENNPKIKNGTIAFANAKKGIEYWIDDVKYLVYMEKHLYAIE
jgi:hypothetical protein